MIAPSEMIQRSEAIRRRDRGEPLSDIARSLQRPPKHDFAAHGLRWLWKKAGSSVR
jgi:hypothetical protein